MRMYVANASIQHNQFHYRISGQPKMRQIEIPPMSQAVLPDDMTVDEMNEVISQHEIYGFISTKELMNGKEPKQRTILLYNIDQPVSSLMINHLYDINRGMLSEFGKRIRQEAAVASNEAIVKTLQAQRQQGLDAEVKDVELEIEELESKDGANHPEPINEKILVAEDERRIPARRRGRG